MPTVPIEVVLMSMGTFDHEEYERRERMISSVDDAENHRRAEFEGRIEYTGEGSVEDLLSRLRELREARHTR